MQLLPKHKIAQLGHQTAKLSVQVHRMCQNNIACEYYNMDLTKHLDNIHERTHTLLCKKLNLEFHLTKEEGKDYIKTVMQDQDKYPTWDTTCSEKFYPKTCFKFNNSRTTRHLDSFFHCVFFWQIGNPDPLHTLYTLLLSISPENNALYIMYSFTLLYYIMQISPWSCKIK